jgi:hypothetical protein
LFLPSFTLPVLNILPTPSSLIIPVHTFAL